MRPPAGAGYTNTTPTLSPRRHLMRALRPLESRDSNRANELRNIAFNRQPRSGVGEVEDTAGPDGEAAIDQIQPRVLIDLRVDLRWSFDFPDSE